MQETNNLDNTLITNTNTINDGGEVYGLTNALIYNTNGTVYGDSNINNNDGSVNFTESPLNQTYVLDKFNLTEGQTRNNSPIIIGSIADTGQDRVYHIDSNVTYSIIPVYLNVGQGIVIHNITMTLDNGTVSYPAYTYNGNGQITIMSLPVINATGSNLLDINYGASCPFGVSGVNGLILLIVVILPIITAVWMIIKREDMDMNKLLLGFTMIIIELVLAGVIANSVTSVCT